jgi:hypothetical protein
MASGTDLSSQVGNGNAADDQATRQAADEEFKRRIRKRMRKARLLAPFDSIRDRAERFILRRSEWDSSIVE